MQFILKQEDQRPDLGSDMDDYWNQRSISLGTEGKKQFLEILNQVIIKKKKKKNTIFEVFSGLWHLGFRLLASQNNQSVDLLLMFLIFSPNHEKLHWLHAIHLYNQQSVSKLCSNIKVTMWISAHIHPVPPASLSIWLLQTVSRF